MATQVNQTWAMDLVHDQLATGRKIRTLAVTDTYSRFSPAVDPRFSDRGGDVVRSLEQVCRDVGYPWSIRVDQGSEFISRDLDLWAYQKNVVLDFSRPGKPADDARAELEAWRKDDNEIRPHSALGQKAPIEQLNRSGATAPP